jgi:ribosome-associated toxin RatA of RatAB toxin-antitoxin module
MADETSGTILIEASPEEVMEVIADFESYPEWAGVSSAEVLDRDDEGRPTAVAFHIEQMGVGADYTLEYVYEPDDGGVTWTTREADGAIREISGAYALEDRDGDTHVTYRLRVDLTVSVPGMIKRQAEKKIVKTALNGLKRRVEEG